MDEGRRLRSRGDLAGAEARFEEAAAAAASGTWEYATARYFAGLTLRDLGDDARAVAAIREALRVYESMDVGTAATVGSVLGLALMRARRFTEAIPEIEAANRRLESLPARSGDLAAGLHNLGMACARDGEPRRGAEAARRAVALHERSDGHDHPDTVESRLALAFALVEAGELAEAGAVLRRSALTIVTQVGPSHGFFADALLTEARRAARQGDGGAAEALARRGLALLRAIGADRDVLRQREYDADVAPLWRGGAPARDCGDVALWRLAMKRVRRTYREGSDLGFDSSDEVDIERFFFVPASWPRSQALHAARIVFADLAAGGPGAPEHDTGFLDAIAATASLPGDAELRDTDFAELLRRSGAEPSLAHSLVLGARSAPLSSRQLALLLAAQGVPAASLLALGERAPALAAARADPNGTRATALSLSAH